VTLTFNLRRPIVMTHAQTGQNQLVQNVE